MSEARAFLLAALQHVADGGGLTAAELDAAIPNPMMLDPTESEAWGELSRWTDDGDVRAKDVDYAAYKRDKMRDRIAALNGYLPDEIERGEHEASHVPWWGRAGIMLLVVAVAGALIS
jgi:hypothetical protein